MIQHSVERPLTALDPIFTRRSVRAYAPQPVDEATIRALLDAAVQAPTAMHEEPWGFCRRGGRGDAEAAVGPRQGHADA